MPRARNLKPGFFKNEALAECSLAARLCFAGLWTLADREGRLEDRPKRIKAELFAFDSLDVEPLLSELARRGLISRYTLDGRGLIQILAFLKHQNPHHREPESVLPTHPSLRLDADGTWREPGVPPPTDPPKARSSPDPSRAESGALNPESGGNTATGVPVAGARPPAEPPQLQLVEPSPKKPPDCPHVALLALWAEVLPALPQHSAPHWRGTRADHLRARWRETAEEKGWADEAAGLLYFRKVFVHVARSPFLTGQVHARDKRPFFCELAWLVEPLNWAKFHEGKYHPEVADEA